MIGIIWWYKWYELYELIGIGRNAMNDVEKKEIFGWKHMNDVD